MIHSSRYFLSISFLFLSIVFFAQQVKVDYDIIITTVNENGLRKDKKIDKENGSGAMDIEVFDGEIFVNGSQIEEGKLMRRKSGF